MQNPDELQQAENSTVDSAVSETPVAPDAQPVADSENTNNPTSEVLEEVPVDPLAEAAADATETPPEVPQLPYDPIALQVVRLLQDAMQEAGHPDNNAWLSSLDNAIFTEGIVEGQCIFLINRALRLLITERRDVPEGDRNAALVGIVDSPLAEQWIKPLKAVTLPVMASFNIGQPGIRFKEGETPDYLQPVLAAQVEASAEEAAKIDNSDISGCHIPEGEVLTEDQPSLTAQTRTAAAAAAADQSLPQGEGSPEPDVGSSAETPATE